MDFRKDIPGWLHSNEVEQVRRICSNVKDGQDILEIGVFAGRTTQIIASVCKSSNIYSIDPWPVSEPPMKWEGMTDYDGPEFDSNDVKGIFEREIVSKYNNVHLVQGKFPECIPKEATNIGLIHWDTDNIDDKEMMMWQFNTAWDLLQPGGILSGHTFADWMPSVVNVVRHLGMFKNCDIILPPSSSIWYMRKVEVTDALA